MSVPTIRNAIARCRTIISEGSPLQRTLSNDLRAALNEWRRSTDDEILRSRIESVNRRLRRAQTTEDYEAVIEAAEGLSA